MAELRQHYALLLQVQMIDYSWWAKLISTPSSVAISLFDLACNLFLEHIRMQVSASLVLEPPAHPVPNHRAVLLQDLRDQSQVVGGKGGVRL